jgi:lysophospholipase L1-like esterase
MSCLIIGDSIAQGVAEIRKDCRSYTQVGISTLGWSKKWLEKIDLVADTIFISLGSNDQYKDFENIADELYHIRADIGYDHKVIWVLPAIKPWIQDLIMEVSYEYGDTVLQMVSLSTDKVHPTTKGYKALAKEIK